jgi:AAA15 family ATPase/GTPase
MEVVMKLLKIVINGLPHFKNELDIDFVALQRVDDYDKERLCNVFSNIYVNKAISFVGINASGKTTILKAILFVMKMLNNESLNNIQSKSILDDLDDNQQVVITTYFYDGNDVNKLETSIVKEISDVDGSEKLIIKDEKLWSKDGAKIKTKKSLFDFAEVDLREKRDKNEQYLMDDVSIIVAENKKKNMNLFISDMLEWTDHNILNVLGRFPKELLTFLDPSIEYLECSFKEKKVDIRLKFYGKEEIIINSPRILENYLSSGTIKGLGVFMSATFSFIEGGYLIIDEIENHFNREIVATLIRFFLDEKVNKNGATILFSTHYSELLDEFDRNDSIYIVRNKEGIGVENLSNILKRNDIKKSEVYDSGYLGGTVPAYEAYMALKKVLSSVK